MVPSVFPWVPLPLPGAPNKMNVRYFMDAFGYTALAADREGKLFRGNRIDIDPTSATIETHAAVNQSEDGVITTEPNVFSRQEFCPTLANNNVARNNHLAAES